MQKDPNNQNAAEDEKIETSYRNDTPCVLFVRSLAVLLIDLLELSVTLFLSLIVAV